jgi:hypothetical protein
MFQNRYYDAGSTGGASTATQTPAQAAQAAQEQAKQQNEQKPAKTFTQEEVNALIAKETGKVEARISKKLSDIEEAEKLKTMSEAERHAAELKKRDEKIAEYEREKLTAQYKAELATKGLPPEIADVLPVANAEAAAAAIKGLQKMMSEKDKAIKDLQEQLNNANLRGKPPQAPTQQQAASKTLPKFL